MSLSPACRRVMAFMHDIARCLALAHQGQIALDTRGRLRKHALRVLAAQVGV